MESPPTKTLAVHSGTSRHCNRNPELFHTENCCSGQTLMQRDVHQTGLAADDVQLREDRSELQGPIAHEAKPSFTVGD